MSSKLALSQLKSLQQSQQRPDGDKDIRKAIRKKRRNNKKQALKAAAKQQKSSSSKLEYYKATASTQKATADLMNKVKCKDLLTCCLCPSPQCTP